MQIGPLTESNKTVFFDNQLTFRLEDDPVVLDMDGVKVCDFITFLPFRGDIEVAIIELKSSAPRPDNENGFNEYLHDIYEKLTNSLLLLIASRTRRIKLTSTPGTHNNSWTGRYPVRFILLITDFESSWCDPLQDELRKKLRPITNSYGQAEVSVVNPELARILGWFNSSTLNIY